MRKFIGQLLLFFAFPAVLAVGWLTFVVVADRRSYLRSIDGLAGSEVLVCSDSQTCDGLNPAVFRGLGNFSAAATVPDQNHLRLTDVLRRHPSDFRYLLIDVTPFHFRYDPAAPVSSDGASRAHFLIHLYHLRDGIRPLGNVAALVRDVLFARKYSEFRKSVTKRYPWRSSIAGAFVPVVGQGFVNPALRAKADADAREKADVLNALPPFGPSAPVLALMERQVALARENGIRPVLITSPVSRHILEKCRPGLAEDFCRTMEAFSRRTGAPWMNYLRYAAEDGHWRDANHLNLDGANAFSRRIFEDFGRTVAGEADSGQQQHITRRNHP